MYIWIFNNKTAVPNKCGTRFLKESFGVDRMYINHYDIFDYNTFDTIIVRNPYEHFKSALHTDMLHLLNNDWSETKSKSDLEKYKYLLNFYLLPKGSPHWSYELYKTIFFYKQKNNIQIIDLNELPNTIKEKYSFKDTFEVWKSKDEIYGEAYNYFPNEMNFLNEKLKEDFSYYQNLIMGIDGVLEREII